MLDGPPNGSFELHVSGALGLTDFANHPVIGNDASGDFVTRFNVQAAARGSDGDATRWTNQAGNDTFSTAQDLGVLFPHELQSGVSVRREANATSPTDTQDYFRFELLQSQLYFFTLTNAGRGDSPRIEVLDSDGHVVSLGSQVDSGNLLGHLSAGTYVLHVSDWSAAHSNLTSYQMDIKLGGLAENPTPLTSGAAPAV